MKKLQATEMRCVRKLLSISYRYHITNDSVRDRIRQAIRPYNDILIMACQDSFTRNSARREQKGPTKEALRE